MPKFICTVAFRVGLDCLVFYLDKWNMEDIVINGLCKNCEKCVGHSPWFSFLEKQNW